ncbi:hypothetical protein H9Q69_005130 [Fusarium xylarioides]|nr:hypothetical protein H9Q70_004876 [Fusarium xylarioides]KAG5781391.1 hypothetical protein H9Q73_004963 [Fusarium xylarioides]KAG5795807.1 hypothetical protein H9Q69_005130 [Fusarium xylarioides]
MPVVRRIPDNKRRSRTGCIPCRRRRRKCDEQRPQCGSCIGRNVTCEFKEWTFVPGVRSSLRKDGSVQGDNGDDADSSLPIHDSLLSFVESSPAPAEPVFESPTFQHRLSLEDAFIANVGRSLLALGNFFYTGPSEWANLHSDCVDVRERFQFFESEEEPLKTLDRFHFKTELAASIITTKSPSLQSLPLMNDTFLTSALTPPSIYDDCLTHLAACCHLIHDEIIPLFNGIAPAQSPTHDSYSLVWATWSKLWARCVQWFRDRPPDMIPLLESPEVDHATSTNTPFTADVYSSAIAVQANLAIHFSALILLSYKPRLVKLSSIPHRLASRSWHAQKLAKVALWNNFSDQWDPVVVATVVRIARDMTYPSQQEALLSCFQRIGDATKIPLQSEIADLQQFWSSSRHTSAPTNARP